MWLLLDKNGICRCMASLPQNLHQDKIDAGMDIYELEDGSFLVGDEYNPSTGVWTPHPENYPQPTEAQLQEAMIAERMAKNDRDQAVAELIAEGALPAGFDKGG